MRDARIEKKDVQIKKWLLLNQGAHSLCYHIHAFLGKEDGIFLPQKHSSALSLASAFDAVTEEFYLLFFVPITSSFLSGGAFFICVGKWQTTHKCCWFPWLFFNPSIDIRSTFVHNFLIFFRCPSFWSHFYRCFSPWALVAVVFVVQSDSIERNQLQVIHAFWSPELRGQNKHKDIKNPLHQTGETDWSPNIKI